MADLLDAKGASSTVSGVASTAPSIHTGKQTETSPAHPIQHNFVRLSDVDLAIVCHSIGGSRNTESQNALHPTSWIYPPKGLPDGLYRDVIQARTSSQYAYYFFSLFFNLALIAQLVLGALLTAFGSRATGKDVVITILAALNTVVAGLLALMHNSGLPDRFQKDWDEFDKVESFMKELMDSGIVNKDMTRDDVIEHCYAKFRKAKKTIQSNKPSAYTGTDGTATPPSGRIAS
ncbi:hypothetical protein G7Y89_g3064 [Cudoniella acicularis]|uniref:SMODS and SLOG-associating 2TM effector domain-containing protein n=1 Tax=Cudoniella acicularis TaxID=354080 RepID=A0A8H4RTB5_9HELO|nr:hypothetical protein G7Y89_g3064 [Cudoniella acicularis]